MNELNEKVNSMKVKLEKSSTIKKLWIACQPLLLVKLLLKQSFIKTQVL